MNAKEFFYLVAEMRSAQQAYFETTNGLYDWPVRFWERNELL